MPRDASGNYTLPPGNPVASGTVVSTEWANPTMQDVGNEITNSLSRDGQGGMRVPFVNFDGVEAAPGIVWVSDQQTGWWLFGVGDMRASTGAEERVRIFDDAASPNGQKSPLQIHDGNEFQNVLTDDFPDDITFHGTLTLLEGAGSGNTPAGNSNNLVIDSDESCGMTFLTGGGFISQIRFGDDVDSGKVRLTALADGSFEFRMTTASALTILPNRNVSIPAGTLTVPSGVVANLTGNATTAGTVTAAAQPAITSVGSLTALTVNGSIGTGGNITAGTAFIGPLTGNVTGNVTGSAGTAGTVTTAAQPAITSVGTLTTLTVNGSGNIGNGLTISGGNFIITSGFAQIGGAITATGNITAFSDARLKDNLLPIGNALDKIAQLVGYTYDKDGERNAGLIANDVKKVLPEAVGEMQGFLTLNDAALTGLIINGLNECREKLDALA